MGSFAAKSFNAVKKNILQVANQNLGLDGTLRQVSDGGGDLSGIYISSGVADELVAKTSGGVDTNIATKYVAQKFTMVGTGIGSVKIRARKQGTVTAGTITARLFIDDEGEPDSAFPELDWMPVSIAAKDLGLTYSEIEFAALGSGLTAGSVFWIVFTVEDLAGGGTIEFDSVVAAEDTDAIATAASLGTWTIVDELELWFKVLGSCSDTFKGESGAGAGVVGHSNAAVGVVGSSEYGTAAQFVSGVSGRAVSVVNRSDEETMVIDDEGIIDYKGTMANSALDPTSDAPADWLEIKIGGTAYFIPVYAASS